jgi:hypothetical protein
MTAFMNEQSGRRVMTGERAVELVNLLAEYVRDSIREGAELQEVVDWTIGDVVEDTVMTTPQSLRERLDVLALELYG